MLVGSLSDGRGSFKYKLTAVNGATLQPTQHVELSSLASRIKLVRVAVFIHQSPRLRGSTLTTRSIFIFFPMPLTYFTAPAGPPAPETSLKAIENLDPNYLRLPA